MRIERAINGWERLFASHERARVDLPERDADRARRLTDAISTLRDDAYDHRLRVHAASRRARPFAPGVHVAARDSAMLASQPRGASSAPPPRRSATRNDASWPPRTPPLPRTSRGGGHVRPPARSERGRHLRRGGSRRVRLVRRVGQTRRARRRRRPRRGPLRRHAPRDPRTDVRTSVLAPRIRRQRKRLADPLVPGVEPGIRPAESRLVATTSANPTPWRSSTSSRIERERRRPRRGRGRGSGSDRARRRTDPARGSWTFPLPRRGDAFVAPSRRGRCYLWDARCAGGKPAPSSSPPRTRNLPCTACG